MAEEFEIAFQVSGRRVRVACNKAYKTNTADKKLEESNWHFGDMFDEQQQQEDIKQICHDLAVVPKCTSLRQGVSKILKTTVKLQNCVQSCF